MNKKWPVVVLMLIGAVFAMIPLSGVISSVNLKKHGVKTEGTVTDRRSKKGAATVTVTFNTPDGTTVTAKASKRTYVKSGDRVTVWYNPASPQKIDFGDTIGSNMKGAIIGILLFLFGLYYFIRATKKENKIKNLTKTGRKVPATFVSVERNEKYNMGDNNPWIIKCKWTDNNNNREYIFLSSDCIIDPGPYLKGRSYLDVFINPADPLQYYMDISFMPKENDVIG